MVHKGKAMNTSIVGLNEKDFNTELERVANRMHKDRVVSKLGKRQMKNVIRDLRKAGDVDETMIDEAMRTLQSRSGIAKKSLKPISELMYDLFIDSRDEVQMEDERATQVEFDDEQDDVRYEELRQEAMEINNQMAQQLQDMFDAQKAKIRSEVGFLKDIAVVLDRHVPRNNGHTYQDELQELIAV
jgi:hypothetical protein